MFAHLCSQGKGNRGKKRKVASACQTTSLQPSLLDVGVQAPCTVECGVQTLGVAAATSSCGVQAHGVETKAVSHRQAQSIDTCHLCYKVHERDCHENYRLSILEKSETIQPSSPCTRLQKFSHAISTPSRLFNNVLTPVLLN